MRGIRINVQLNVPRESVRCSLSEKTRRRIGLNVEDLMEQKVPKHAVFSCQVGSDSYAVARLPAGEGS